MKCAMTHQDFIRLGWQYMPFMKAQAIRLTKDADAARDLLQEAALLAYKNRHQYRSGTNFRAWSSRIIRNVFLSQVRQEKRRRELMAEKPPHLGWTNPEATAHNPAEGKLGAEHIMGLIDKLPIHFRHPFLLHYEGVKYKEISNRLGIPIGTAKSRVFTARTILKEQVVSLYRIKA